MTSTSRVSPTTPGPSGDRDAPAVEADPRLAETERERDALREEVAAWRWEAEHARRELARLQTSRLWRWANLYWGFRRRLAFLLRAFRRDEGTLGVEEAAPRPAFSVPPLPPGFPAVPAGRPDVIVLAIIDWDFRFQRPQQIASQYARAGHRVFYLSTSRFLPSGGAPWSVALKAVRVVELCLHSRRGLDLYAGRLEGADLAELEERFGDLYQSLALGDVLLHVHLPFWWPLAQHLRRRFGWRVLYDCMDEWQSFPGIGPAVLEHERALVEQADLVLTSSRRLFAKWQPAARQAALVPNGVDLAHYRRYYDDSSLLDDAAHPVLGYFGALASWVDVELLRAVAERFPAATLVLAGGVFDLDLAPLAGLPNVRILGQRPYEEMPRLLWRFDVCLIPFRVNAITHAANPVKLYEYFSSGKPVVAPRLEELEAFRAVCYLAAGEGEFLAALEQALAEPLDDPRRPLRRRIAEESDWSGRRAAIDAACERTLPRVSVLIVTHGALHHTRRCLTSLLEGETWPRLEVLVVDNASPDETAAYLRQLDDPRLRLFFPGENLGFPRANNLAFGQARGEVVVFLNNDTVVPPGLLGRLVRHLEADPKLGLVCATTNFCGNEALVAADYDDLADLPRSAARRARRQAGRLFDLPVAALYCVAAWARVLDEIGPLDEAFGLGLFEDDDYSLRVREAGYRVVCAEDAYVHHVGQASFQQLSAEEYRALWRQNQEHFERKWQRPWKPHSHRPGATPVLSKVRTRQEPGR